MKIKSAIASLLLIGAVFTVQAQTATPVATGKQVNQQIRIKNGVKSGELTKQEFVQLQSQQVHINRTKRRAKADGVVTPAERAKINRKQSRANRNIYRQKHDRQDRY